MKNLIIEFIKLEVNRRFNGVFVPRGTIVIAMNANTNTNYGIFTVLLPDGRKFRTSLAFNEKFGLEI